MFLIGWSYLLNFYLLFSWDKHSGEYHTCLSAYFYWFILILNFLCLFFKIVLSCLYRSISSWTCWDSSVKKWFFCFKFWIFRVKSSFSSCKSLISLNNCFFVSIYWSNSFKTCAFFLYSWISWIYVLLSSVLPRSTSKLCWHRCVVNSSYILLKDVYTMSYRKNSETNFTFFNQKYELQKILVSGLS